MDLAGTLPIVLILIAMALIVFALLRDYARTPKLPQRIMTTITTG